MKDQSADKKRAEVLAPAGSFESMKAAVSAGADAVYIGGSRFGARAFAENPGQDQLLQAIDYVHLHNRRLYLTVNTLLKEREMGELYDYLEPYYRQGLDGVIVQDLGVLSFLREAFPGLPLHASTQMTVTGVYGARLLKELGVVRIVPAREISLSEAAAIREKAGIEVECFVHGALCYCYSGQCLLSSLIGGRSGNRGRCAQPCRLPYDVLRDGRRLSDSSGRYVMSLKDLCTVGSLPDLLDAGVDSLKIEGRMKSPRYTAGVVSVYRKYVDLYLEKGRAGWKVDPADLRMLSDLFDRGGFTAGYLNQHNGRDMIALKEKPGFREGNQKLFDYLDDRYVRGELREPVSGTVRMEAGSPVCLELTCRGRKAEARGDVPSPAQNQPISAEKLRRQMMKMGNSPFAFERPENLTVELDDGLFLPVQALNDLRRRAVSMLEEAVLGPRRREGKTAPPNASPAVMDGDGTMGSPAPVRAVRPDKRPALHALVQNREQQEAMLDIEPLSRIYLESALWPESDWERAAKRCHDRGKACYLAMPVIFRSEAEDYFKKNRELLVGAGFDGLLVRSLEELEFIKEQGIDLPAAADFNLYGWNRRASEMLRWLGAGEQTLPLELNSRELAEVGAGGKELVAYGYLPAMATAQCVRRTVEGCGGRTEVLWMKDRTGKELPVQNFCRFCYNVIYNPLPLSLLGQGPALDRLAPGALRLQMTLETGREAARAARAFARELYGEAPGQEESGPAGEMFTGGFTRGHWKRGVE